MDIYMVWATEGTYFWLVDSWDSDSYDDNAIGFKEAMDKHYKDHGPGNVRVVKGTVNFDAVTKAFEIPNVGSL